MPVRTILFVGGGVCVLLYVLAVSLLSASAACANSQRAAVQAGAELHRSLKVQAELLERLQAVEAAAGQQAVQSAELPRALRAEATATYTNAAAAIADGGDGGEAGDGGSVASRRLPERQTGMDARDVAPSAAAATSGNVSAATLVPARIAVVVIAYNRPEYLEQALSTIFKHHPGGDAYPVYVSQDGPNDKVKRVIERHGARHLVHPRQPIHFGPSTPIYLVRKPGYAYLSVHYAWALNTIFGEPERFDGIIILEEDIEIAPDFFGYFSATAPLLSADASLLCVSAFNDNGQPDHASDARALYRSDFFPGLGWLLTRSLWAELAPKWPNETGFWDDWLREPPQRRGRASIRPELSRSYTFGKKGTSQSQFFDTHLGRIQLAREKDAVDWAHEDLGYLLKPSYDARFAASVAAARVVSLREAMRPSDDDVRVLYSGPTQLESYATQLRIMSDLKAGVPRTAYKGVVTLRIHHRLVYLAPRYAVDQDITKPIRTP